MTKAQMRKAIRNAEDALSSLRRTRTLVDSPLLVAADDNLMDWLDSAIAYRDNPNNWKGN
jgi:hypothetical protein